MCTCAGLYCYYHGAYCQFCEFYDEYAQLGTKAQGGAAQTEAERLRRSAKARSGGFKGTKLRILIRPYAPSDRKKHPKCVFLSEPFTAKTKSKRRNFKDRKLPLLLHIFVNIHIDVISIIFISSVSYTYHRIHIISIIFISSVSYS